MTIMWMSEKGRSLMGKVLEQTEESYVTQVTSVEYRSDKKLIGKKFLVRKQNAVMATVNCEK